MNRDYRGNQSRIRDAESEEIRARKALIQQRDRHLESVLLIKLIDVDSNFIDNADAFPEFDRPQKNVREYALPDSNDLRGDAVVGVASMATCRLMNV